MGKKDDMRSRRDAFRRGVERMSAGPDSPQEIQRRKTKIELLGLRREDLVFWKSDVNRTEPLIVSAILQDGMLRCRITQPEGTRENRMKRRQVTVSPFEIVIDDTGSRGQDD
jgi:hypothetical protein